jgi:hypothetical protein
MLTGEDGRGGEEANHTRGRKPCPLYRLIQFGSSGSDIDRALLRMKIFQEVYTLKVV